MEEGKRRVGGVRGRGGGMEGGGGREERGGLVWRNERRGLVGGR